jgi:hypothetical protein
MADARSTIAVVPLFMCTPVTCAPLRAGRVWPGRLQGQWIRQSCHHEDDAWLIAQREPAYAVCAPRAASERGSIFSSAWPCVDFSVVYPGPRCGDKPAILTVTHRESLSDFGPSPRRERPPSLDSPAGSCGLLRA